MTHLEVHEFDEGKWDGSSTRTLAHRCAVVVNCVIDKVNNGTNPVRMLWTMEKLAEAIHKSEDGLIDIPDVLEGKTVTEDMVNHPAHYLKGEMETIDEMVRIFGVDKVVIFCHLNAYKYKSPAPFNIWFKYPIHKWDGSEEFQALRGDAEKDNSAKAEDGKKRKKEATDERIREAVEDLLNTIEAPKMKDIEDKTGLSRNRIKKFIDENDDFLRTNEGVINRKVTVTPSEG